MHILSEAEKYTIDNIVLTCKDVIKTNKPDETFNKLKKNYKKSIARYKKSLNLLEQNGLSVVKLNTKISDTFGDLSDDQKRDLSIQGIMKTISIWFKNFFKKDFLNGNVVKAILIDNFIRATLTGIFAVICNIDLNTMRSGSLLLDVLFIGILGPLSEEISKFCALKTDSQGSFLIIFGISEFLGYTLKYGILKFLTGGISFYSLTMYIAIRWIGVMIHTLTMKIQANPDKRYSTSTKFTLGYIVHATWNTMCVLGLILGDVYSFTTVVFGLSFISLMGKIMDKILNKQLNFGSNPEPAYA